MLRVLSSALNRLHQRRSSWIKYCSQGKRFFLTEAYRCQEAWANRLQAPIMLNIKLEDMYYELDQKFQQDGKASAIDVDLYANAVIDDSYIDELEDVVHKLRISPNADSILPSTSHAFIRLLLDQGKVNQLLQVLNDRLNYGIFPDNYCSSLLMDTLIQQENYTAAAQVAVLQMLQEDWSDSICSHLALYACHMHLKQPGTWEMGVEEEEPEDSGEEVKVRVKFLRNPFFDDHFDLRDPALLVGKTLASVGATFSCPVGATYQLIGWAMYNKWQRCISMLEQLISGKQTVFTEGIKRVEDILELQLATEGTSLDAETKDKITSLVNKLILAGLVKEEDLHEAVLTKVQANVTSLEADAISAQKQNYEFWEKQRLATLHQQMDALRKQQRLAKVKEEKKKLDEKEKQLFFFDNEDKVDLLIDSKRVYYPKKFLGKKKPKRVKDENYIPPEI